jgi:AdoMet-dependent heme synthase
MGSLSFESPLPVAPGTAALAEAPPQRVQPDPPPPLRSLYIYLTHECNQHCGHCWINPTLEGRYCGRRPAFEEYRRFFDAAVPMGLDYIKLTGGEPLLRPEFRPLIEYAAAAGIAVQVETNGMLVTPEIAAFMKHHGVQTSISLDAATAAVHDRRRGLRGAFDRTMAAVEILGDAGVPVMIVTSISRSNLDEVPRILDLLVHLKRKAPLNYKINPIVPMGRAKHMERRGETLTPRELLDLAGSVTNDLTPRYRAHGIGITLQLEIAFFSIDNLIRGEGRGGLGHCGFLNLISILADGSITFCGLGYAAPELVMGNICEDYDLPELWRSHPLLAEVRRVVRGDLEGVCGECLFQPVCLGGCRAVALAAGGTLAASPVWCQALYDAGLFPASRLRDPAKLAPTGAGSRRHA